MGPLNFTVPVDALPPLKVAGLTDTAVSVGPAGVSALTDSSRVVGVLPTQAVIVTNSAGAAALDVM